MLNFFFGGVMTLTSFYVVDGDTLREGMVSIRLWGIDAPEMDTQAGRDARRYLIELTRGDEITCEQKGTDGYGRRVAICMDSLGSDLACSLLEAGHAEEWFYFSNGYYRECRND